MPNKQISHSLILKGRIMAKASSIQIKNVREEIKRKDAMPSASPILKIVAPAVGLLYILNKRDKANKRIVLQSKGVEK